MKTKQLILIQTIKRPIVIENNLSLTDSKQSLQLRRKTHARTKKRKLYYRAYTPVRTPKLLQKIRQISPDIAADNPVDYTTVTNVP